jgi:hypothetical protein
MENKLKWWKVGILVIIIIVCLVALAITGE